jgi:4-carboxymuconolactone decarboxylase
MNEAPLDRQKLRDLGREVRQAMQHGSFGTTTNVPLSASVPSLGDFTTEAVFGAVWGRPQLDLEHRMICTLATLATGQFVGQLRTYVHSALTMGISREAIEETIIQVGWYVGMPTLVNGIAVIQAVFGERGVQKPAARPVDDRAFDELRTAGARIAAIGSQSSSGTWKDEVADLERIYCYGQVWGRPGLDPKSRSGVAIAVLTSLGCTSELRGTIAIGLHFGFLADQIAEVMLQTAPYSGYAKAKEALAVLDEVSPRVARNEQSTTVAED